MLKNVVDKLGLNNKPQNIFNVDETNLSSAAANNRVFARKGSSSVNKIVGNNEKQNYTIQVIKNNLKTPLI